MQLNERPPGDTTAGMAGFQANELGRSESPITIERNLETPSILTVRIMPERGTIPPFAITSEHLQGLEKMFTEIREQSYDELQKLFMGNLEHNEKLFNEYHALLVELGKNVCRKKPLCANCPANSFCDYYNGIKIKT